MAKNSLNDWSTIVANNTDIAGTNIGVGCPPQDVGVYMRTAMAQIAYAVQGSGGAVPATWHTGAIIATTGTIGALTATTLSVSGSLAIPNLDLSGTLTVGGVTTFNGPVSVTVGGMSVEDGLLVNDAALITGVLAGNGGLAILGGGSISGGLTIPTGSLVVTAGTLSTSGVAVIGQPGTATNQAVTFSQFVETHANPMSAAGPGGLVIKGGTATSSASGVLTVTFGTAFPNAVVSVIANLFNATPVASGWSVGVTAQSTAAASFVTGQSGIGTSGMAFNWQAIGY